MKFNLKNTVCCLATIFISLFINDCCAQSKIKLDQVIKFELYTHDGGLSSDERKLEVTLEHGKWKCHQTKLVSWKGKSDSRTFVKEIPAHVLKQLLVIINQQDTGKKVKLFNININDLSNRIDSIKSLQQLIAQLTPGSPPYIKTKFKPEQLKEFIEAIKNKDIIAEALEKALTPISIADETSYTITVITKGNYSFTIKAFSLGFSYNLPWYIGKIKSYDPNTSLIFEYISGNDKYPEREKRYLYDNINRNIYWKYFQTRFNWEDFKNEEPQSYQLLKGTLTPAKFIKFNNSSNVLFKSSLLPQYVQIQTFFKKDDKAAIRRYKRFEDTLVTVFKKNNFLFDYLKTRPDAKMILQPDLMGNDGQRRFKDLAKYYHEIEKFNYKDSHSLIIIGADDLISKWIWLPNNTLLLIAYNNNKLLSIPQKYLIPVKNLHEQSVCILFNDSGSVIHNYGLADLGIQ